MTLWVSPPQEMNCTPVSAITLHRAGRAGGRAVAWLGVHLYDEVASEARQPGQPTHAPDCVQRDVAGGFCLDLALPNQGHGLVQSADVQPRCGRGEQCRYMGIGVQCNRSHVKPHPTYENATPYG